MLITLQQVGNVKYTGWVLLVPCSTKRKVIDDLQKRAKLMEVELFNWRRSVKLTRGNFYELNYFSTLQLLTLRRDLGKIKNPNSPAVITPDVIALLQSISSQITPSVVSKAVRQVSSEGLQSLAESNKQPQASPEDVEDISDNVMFDIQPSVSQKTAKAKVETSLTESQLTQNQKEILINLVESMDYPKSLVLKAFEELSGKDHDKYDYQRWCNDNMDQFLEDDESEEGDFADEESDSDDDESSSSDSDNEVTEKEFNYSTGTVIIP